MPPWVPVVGIMLLVFGILAGIFVIQGSTAQPRINDHWHAGLRFIVFGEQSPDLPAFDDPDGIHTHGDGILHSHPYTSGGEGVGAAIGKYVEYAGYAFGTGELTDDTLQVPGEDRLWRNGDVGPDGEPGFVQILAASTSVDPDIAGFTQFQEICRNLPSTQYGEVSPRYIPQHGDCVIVMFAPMGYFPSGSGLSQTDAGSGGVSDTDAEEEDVAAYVPPLIASP